jgi:hypothetical protein
MCGKPAQSGTSCPWFPVAEVNSWPCFSVSWGTPSPCVKPAEPWPRVKKNFDTWVCQRLLLAPRWPYANEHRPWQLQQTIFEQRYGASGDGATVVYDSGSEQTDWPMERSMGISKDSCGCLLSVPRPATACRLPDYADSPSNDSGWRGSGRVLTRHNQRLSRKPNSLSSGRYRVGLTPSGSVRDSAFSFKRMSA